MRKSNVKIKGKLRTYLYLPLLLTMLLIIINVFVYMEDTSSGVLFSGFVLLYFVIMLIACTTGLRTRGGPREIGFAVTKSVVFSLIAILTLDYFITRALS